MQLIPTTSAPAASIRFAASPGVQPSRVVGAWWRQSVTTAGSPVRLIASVASTASSPQLNVSPMMKSTPPSTAQPTCSSNIAATASRAPASPAA